MDSILKSMGIHLPPIPPWLAQAADDIKSLVLTGEIEPPIIINGVQYHLEETIGEGGYALVYGAREVVPTDQPERPRMAVKEAVLGTTEAESRYLAEVEMLSYLKGHPNTLPLIGHCRVKNPATKAESGYLLTPLYTGSLESLLIFRRLSSREVLTVLSSICSALAYCHEEKGRSHRDIKTSNVLINQIEEEEEDGDGDEQEATNPGLLMKEDESKISDVVLCDWGSAGPAKEPLPKSRQEALTIQEWAEANVTASYRPIELWDVPYDRYEPPEADPLVSPATLPLQPSADDPEATDLKGKDLDWAAADVWAVGCLLYASMYGGQAPYYDDRGGSVPLAALSRSVKFPFHPDDPKCYPQSFHDQVMACLELNPASRPTARQLMSWSQEELERLTIKT